MNILQADNSKHTCMARLQTNPCKQCSNKKKNNSDFCGVHLRSKHILRIDDNTVQCSIQKKKKQKTKQKSNFVIDYKHLEEHNFNCKHYYYSTIKYNMRYYKLTSIKQKKKSFERLKNHIVLHHTTNTIYVLHIDKLQLISKLYRGFHIRKINKLKGEGFLHLSLVNNQTDFLNFTDIKNISYYNLITYKDNKDFIYAFDIHSLLTYIEELQRTHIKKTSDISTLSIQTIVVNPYTREIFPTNFLDNMYYLKAYNDKHIKHTTDTNPTPQEIQPSLQMNVSIKTENKKKQLTVKRQCVSIFQRMDELELYTQARWFLDLNIYKLRKLYFMIEDIWRYRASLTLELRKKFVSNGRAFEWPYGYIKMLTDKIKLQRILLHEFNKFVHEGQTKDDCITASYWILMGLTTVSEDAAAGCPALVQSMHP